MNLYVCVLICWCTERHFYILHVGTSTVKSIKRLASPETVKTETESNASELKTSIATL